MNPESLFSPISPDSLRATDAAPDVPFCVELGVDPRLRVVRLLRVLPGRRLVGEAWLDDTHVLAKLFVSSSSARHYTREIDGITRLRNAGIATPELVAHGRLPPGGHYVLTRFLEKAESFASHWSAVLHTSPGRESISNALCPIFTLLGRLHQAGLTHDDLHPGNFLIDGESLLVIDGDAVRGEPGTAVRTEAATRNLGMLFAQYPVTIEDTMDKLLDAYTSGNPSAQIDPILLNTAIDRARQARWLDYARKLQRNCSLFSFERTHRKLLAVERCEQAALAPLINAPDDWIAQGTALKRGRTATVSLVNHNGRAWVIKRYNIKNALHALSRAPRPTRAWKSWIEGHRLERLGIATAIPRAVMESRFGPLRGRGWLISDYVPGVPLSTLLNPDVPPDVETADALTTLFRALVRCRITHGDLKASNLIWHEGRIHLIDLDATTQHRSDAAFRRAWARDRSRLIRNWPSDSQLVSWLNLNLPPVK